MGVFLHAAASDIELNCVIIGGRLAILVLQSFIVSLPCSEGFNAPPPPPPPLGQLGKPPVKRFSVSTPPVSSCSSLTTVAEHDHR